MKSPTRLSEAIAIIDDVGSATIHGPIPQETVHEMWKAAAILAHFIRERTDGPVLLAGNEDVDVSKARDFATRCHKDANCTYGGKPYEVHLKMVVDAARDFSHLLPSRLHSLAFAGAWVHDVIEDTGKSYNDVARHTSEAVAEVAYRLTNEKGRSRHERANALYYMGIVRHPVAHYVKLCDRIANITHSKAGGSGMFDRYAKEHAEFSAYLHCEEYKAMFEHMETMLFGAPLARAGF